MQLPKKLVSYTALALVKQQTPQQITQIRQQYDPAYPRWPAHINIIYPFIQPSKFDEYSQILINQFKQFKSFTISLNQISTFPHGVCYLVPSTTNQQIATIHQKIIQQFPQLANNKHGGFVPHLTLANKINKNQVQNLRKKLQQDWKPQQWICNGLHFLQRDKDTPFKTIKFIKFQNSQ